MQQTIYVGYGPFPVTVTTRIITFLVGNPYKPLFATVTGKGPHPKYMNHGPGLENQSGPHLEDTVTDLPVFVGSPLWAVGFAAAVV